MPIFVKRHARGNFIVRAFYRKGTKKERAQRDLRKTINDLSKVYTSGSKTPSRYQVLRKRYHKFDTMIHAGW